MVRDRHEGFRKASLWLLGLIVATCVFGLIWTTMVGTEHVTITIFDQQYNAPPLWQVYIVLILTLAIFGLPFYWLWQDTYTKPGAR